MQLYVYCVYRIRAIVFVHRFFHNQQFHNIQISNYVHTGILLSGVWRDLWRYLSLHTPAIVI
jgi:hypothetical protein